MKKGFTLIELLVVVLIIGILSAIALPQYTKAVERARSAEALTNISTMKKQVELYILENGLPSSGFVQYKDFANVDLSGGQWNGNSYTTKNASYSAFISSNGGYIVASFMKNGQGGYGFAETSTYDERNLGAPKISGWYSYCWTDQMQTGQNICKHYENFGFTYLDMTT